jgi:hypothetical protein
MTSCRLGLFLVSYLLQTLVVLLIFRVPAAILAPVSWICFLPVLLAFPFVDPIIRIRLEFFPLPFILSCLLTGLCSTVLLHFHPCISPHNPSATGAPKCDLFHRHLHGLSNLDVGKIRIKSNDKEKTKEDPPNMHQDIEEMGRICESRL